MADPRIDLYARVNNVDTIVASNSDWGAGNGAAMLRPVFASVGAFDLADAASRDAALVITAPAGAYTAQVSGVGNATGEALIEIYELP